MECNGTGDNNWPGSRTLSNVPYPRMCKEKVQENKKMEANIFTIVRDALIGQGVVFFGSLAHGIYSTYMPKKEGRRVIQKNPDFDVMSLKPDFTATIVKERLEYNGFNGVSIVRREGIGEIIAPHYEVILNGDTICLYDRQW